MLVSQQKFNFVFELKSLFYYKILYDFYNSNKKFTKEKNNIYISIKINIKNDK